MTSEAADTEMRMADRHISSSGKGRAHGAPGEPASDDLDSELQSLYQSYGSDADMPEEIRRLAAELEAKLAERSRGDAPEDGA